MHIAQETVPVETNYGFSIRPNRVRKRFLPFSLPYNLAGFIDDDAFLTITRSSGKKSFSNGHEVLRSARNVGIVDLDRPFNIACSWSYSPDRSSIQSNK